MSDRGEFLGEAGLYLQGAPWFMAPEDQTRVPMMLWMSDGSVATMGPDRACQTVWAVHRHDRVFALPGLFDAQTAVRDARLYTVGACRVAP